MIMRHADKLRAQIDDLNSKHDEIADIKSAHDSDEQIDGKWLCSMQIMRNHNSDMLSPP